MLLRIDEQDKSKPPCLTLDLFASLMSSENRRKAVFQLLSFSKKRDRTYSTRMSDGFFNVKVMVIHEAADQIDSGQIKQYYILQGWIRNHGEGAVVVKDKLTQWEHSFPVGCSIKWKLNRTNINYNGSNLIKSKTQCNEQSFKSGLKMPYPKLTPAKSQRRKSRKGREKGSNRRKSKSKRKEGSVQTPVKSAEEDKANRKYDFLFESTEKKQISEDVDGTKMLEVVQALKGVSSSLTQSLEKVDKQSSMRQQGQKVELSVEKVKQRLSENKAKQIWQLLLCDSDEEEQPITNEQLGENTSPEEQPFEVRRNKSSYHTQPGKRIDLQFIVDMLADSDSEHPTTSQQQKEPSEHSDSDVDLLQLIDSKQRLQSVKEKREESSSISRQGREVSMWDLYNGVFSGSRSEWYFKFVLKCMVEQKGGYFLSVLTDIEHQLLINASLRNTDQFKSDLREGATYCCKGAVVRPNSMVSTASNSNCEVEIDGAFCEIQLVQAIENSFSQDPRLYTALDEIPQTPDEHYVNVVGLILNFKLRKTKAGKTMANYEIVDPTSKSCISIVKFDPSSPEEYEQAIIDRPVTLYNVQVTSFNGKKNLVCKAHTLLRVNWLPMTSKADLIREWMKTHSSARQVELEPSGFSLVDCLAEVVHHSSNNTRVKGVRVLQFKPKFTYKACNDCLKKVEEGRCRSCGPRREHQVSERVFLRGDIGDQSRVLEVIWSTPLAEQMLLDGFVAMRREWTLRVAEVWLQRAGCHYTIAQMKEMTGISEMCGGLMGQIKASMLIL